jgi:hypothetical protein
VRFSNAAPAPAASTVRAEVVVNDVPVPDARVSDASGGDAAAAVLFLVDTSKNMEGWIAAAKRALQSYLEEEAKASPAINRFGLSTFTTTRSEVVPFSAAQAIQPEALRRLRAGQQERVQIWESCEVAIGRFDLNPVDAGGGQLPVRRYLVIITNGQGNADDTVRERCLKAALGAQVPVLVVGPRPAASGTMRALRDVAEKSFGRYFEVRGPNELTGALRQLRAALAAEPLRIVEFGAGDLTGLLDTNNKIVLKLIDVQGTVVATSERLFNLSEAFRSRLRPHVEAAEAGAGSGEDAGADDADADSTETVPDAGYAQEDAADGGDAGTIPVSAESSSGAGVLAVVVIAAAIMRSRRHRCPNCSGPLAAGEELCANCQTAASQSKTPAAPKLLAELLVREGPNKGQRMVIVEETILLGRDPEKCQAVIDDDAVSRVHCTIRLFPEGWRITDMSSSFGISLGGRKISPEKWADLQDGETIKIGNVELVFLDKTRERAS